MSPIIIACSAQALMVLVILAVGKEMPDWVNDWPFFILINLIPLAVGVWVSSTMKTWKSRILTMFFAMACTLAVLIIYGVLGVAMSLFVFNK